MASFWHPSFDARPELLSLEERVLVSYDRATAVLQSCELGVHDIQASTRAFIDMHRHPIMAVDAACTNILACSINLFVGTLIQALPRRPETLPIILQALRGEIFGNFLLTEVDHGLDIMSLETIAVKVEDGFILSTPTHGSRKFMPPTTPHPRATKYAVVFARVLENNNDRGVHPFLVKTSEAGRMCPGVSAILLPPRSGTCPLDYAITSFDNVKLPFRAFLGSTLSPTHDHHATLMTYIGRIVNGQIAVTMVALTGLKIASYLGVVYSLRRQVRGPKGLMRPIIQFRTQQLPVLYSVAIAHVLIAWAEDVTQSLQHSQGEDTALRGQAVIFKSTILRLAISSFRAVGERLGTQGTFGHNFISQIEMDARGFVIAEGDITTTSIRLYSELLQKKRKLPTLIHLDTLLAKHAMGIFARSTKVLEGLEGGHRDPRFNRLLLPQCERGVLALGCSQAYSSALEHEVPLTLLNLFECASISLDPGWYSEELNLGEEKRLMREDDAVQAALPHLQEYVDALNISQIAPVPMTSDIAWSTWVDYLQIYSDKKEDDVSYPMAQPRMAPKL